jgi:hypothetical protein
MLRIGFAVAAIFGVAGLALMALGYSATPTAANAMLFTAGAVLLGAAGISLSIAGAVHQPAPAVIPRAERSIPMPDPFVTQPKSPSLDPVMPAVATAGAVIGAASLPTIASPDMPGIDSGIDGGIDSDPAPMPNVAEERIEPPVAEMAAVQPPSVDDMVAPPRTMPSFELPPLRPRQSMDSTFDLPELPGMAARKEPVMETLDSVTIAEPVAVPMPEETVEVTEQTTPEPALTDEMLASDTLEVVDEETPEADHAEAEPEPVEAEEAAQDEPEAADPFDLEAAIAAELGVVRRTNAVEEAATSVEDAADAEGDAEPASLLPMAEEEPFAVQADPAENVEEAAPEPAPAEDEAVLSSADIVVGSYESGGVLYTLFEDGSVTAEAGGVKERYASLEALRTAFDAA